MRAAGRRLTKLFSLDHVHVHTAYMDQDRTRALECRLSIPVQRFSQMHRHRDSRSSFSKSVQQLVSSSANELRCSSLTFARSGSIDLLRPGCYGGARLCRPADQSLRPFDPPLHFWRLFKAVSALSCAVGAVPRSFWQSPSLKMTRELAAGVNVPRWPMACCHGISETGELDIVPGSLGRFEGHHL